MTTETPPPPSTEPVSPLPPPASREDHGPVWAVATGIFWGLVFAAFIGVWKASQEVGVATWWRGPRSAPRPVLVQILPLVAPSVLVVAAALRWRRLALLSLAASIVTLLIALGDLGPIPKLAAVELALGGAGLVFSLAAIAAERAARVADPAP